jgi:diacylglycerol kinase family enzyme
MHDAGPVLVVENTRSGTAGETDGSERLRKAFRVAGIAADFVEASTGADIAALVDDALQAGHRMIVAAGGDGSVSATAARLLGTDAVLGVIPFGTLNHFAKDIGIPHDIEDAVVTLKCGVVRAIDVAEVNGRPFLNNSGIGLYPKLVREREEIRSLGYRKSVALLRALVPTLRNLPLTRVRLHAGGQTLERGTPFVFVGNNVYELEGLKLGSRLRLNGGELCVCVAHRVGAWGVARLAASALLGRLRSARDFDVFRAREVWVDATVASLPVSLDGEVAQLETPLHYRIRPAALKVVAPRRESDAVHSSIQEPS